MAPKQTAPSKATRKPAKETGFTNFPENKKPIDVDNVLLVIEGLEAERQVLEKANELKEAEEVRQEISDLYTLARSEITKTLKPKRRKDGEYLEAVLRHRQALVKIKQQQELVKSQAKQIDEQDAKLAEVGERADEAEVELHKDLTKDTKHKREKVKLATENRLLKDQVLTQEKTIESFMHLATPDFKPPRWMLHPKKIDSSLEMPVLFVSDEHAGEVVEPSALNNSNCYCREVAAARIKRTVSRAIVKFNPHEKKYPGIFLLRGGDHISGSIHRELERTNDMQALEASLFVVEQWYTGIKKLADAFGNVHVVSVAGNHSRTSEKFEHKAHIANNHDYQIAVMLEQRLRDDKRISFYTPTGPDAVFQIFGYNFVLTHGDRIGTGGGQGFLGPIAPITRGGKKTRDQHDSLLSSDIYRHELMQHTKDKLIELFMMSQQKVNYIAMGHYHVPTYNGAEGFITNGSSVGMSEYAGDLRVRFTPPSHTIFTVNAKYGVAGAEQLFVGDAKEDLALFVNRQVGVLGQDYEAPEWEREANAKAERIRSATQRAVNGRLNGNGGRQNEG